MPRLRIIGTLALTILLLVVLTGCQGDTPPPLQATGGAKQVMDLGFKIPKNALGNTAEQQNIIDRIKVTTDPTKVMWIHLMTIEGKVVQRMPVARKVTSSGKRLEPITAASQPYQGSDYPKFLGSDGKTYQTSEFMQPDGTFGASDNYIFWFDPMHRYHQWGTAGGMGYLLTDYPLDLRNPIDLIIGMGNADQAASDWQKRQETALQAGQDAICKEQGKTRYTLEGGCQ